MAPIGADKVSTRRAYAQVDSNALRNGKPSAETISILHQFDLDRIASRQPEEALRRLHRIALDTGERDLLFALAELSYVAGDKTARSIKPWESRDARDFYLGSAVYAWLFLFSEGEEPPPGPFDRRFREACDFYNSSVGLALMTRKSTNALVTLESSRRRLPVGEIDLELSCSNFPTRLDEFHEILLADQFRVRGLSVRNREPGLGAPLICVRQLNPELQVRTGIPATALVRVSGSLAEISSGKGSCSLELYAGYNERSVDIGTTKVPLETDLTTFRAYALNQSRIWKLGKLDFLAPAEHVSNHLLPSQPFDPNRIPLVLVHGTFSSPVTWAEMGNTLVADPVLRQRYQIWTFIYGSGNPLLQSMADLRMALADEVHRHDPQGTNTALHQMVVLGHSQGGLLTKATAIRTDDRIWHIINTNRFEDVELTDSERDEARRMLFFEPLPFVKRVIFIATPHRGSYLAGGFVRRLGRRLVSLPHDLISRSANILNLTEGSEAGRFLRGKVPTSLDGMSPKNPGLLALADLPVVPPIKAHSIIPVQGNMTENGTDGVVSYSSAHVDYVQSEFIVRSKHSCLDEPATIQEVRRILHEHLQQLDQIQPQSTNDP